MQGASNQQESLLMGKAFCLSITEGLPYLGPTFFLHNLPDISDYENKSYPTLQIWDKIAEYFNATPTQLFGTSKEIELERVFLNLMT